MNKTLQDTDTYSEVLKKKNPQVRTKAEAYLKEHKRHTISAFTVFEIIWGLQRMQREERIAEILNELPDVEVLPFDVETAVTAGRIFGDLQRLGQTIGSIDVMIAATALRHNLILTTGNTRHFERIAALGYPLQLDNWKTS